MDEPVELRSDAWIHRCVTCGLISHDGPVDEMSYWADSTGELVCYCGTCAKRRFDWPPATRVESAAETGIADA
jgi:hypothetical protein